MEPDWHPKYPVNLVCLSLGMHGGKEENGPRLETQDSWKPTSQLFAFIPKCLLSAFGRAHLFYELNRFKLVKRKKRESFWEVITHENTLSLHPGCVAASRPLVMQPASLEHLAPLLRALRDN